MAVLVFWAAGALFVLLSAWGVCLLLYWLSHRVPGAALNSLRRTLFRVSYPWLKAGEKVGPITAGKEDLTPLFFALALFAAARWGVPWLFLMGFEWLP